MTISMNGTAVSGVWVGGVRAHSHDTVIYAPMPAFNTFRETEKNLYIKCEYCGSRCADTRGNCGACGAPKE